MNEVQLPHDIEDAIALPVRYGWILAVLIVLAIVLGWLVWWILKRRQKKPVVVETPAQLLKRRLGELRIDSPFDRGAQKFWAHELSLLLRTGAEMAWRIPATDRTSDELINEFRKLATASDVVQGELIAILRQLDRVQFAEFDVDAETARTLHEQAKQLIHTLIGEAT